MVRAAVRIKKSTSPMQTGSNPAVKAPAGESVPPPPLTWTPGTPRPRPSANPAPIPPGRVDEAQLRRALAVQLTKIGGSGTAEDVAAVIDEVAKLPLLALRQMQANGTKVVACRNSVTDYMPELKGQAPRGWPPGSTWDAVPGLFYPGKNEVVVGTRASASGGRVVPPTGEGHGATSLVVHESGHSLDYRGGMVSSKDAAFLAAYEADKAKLPPYLQQAPPAGHEEAFAESLSISATHSPQGASMPNLMAYWQNHNPFGART